MNEKKILKLLSKLYKDPDTQGLVKVIFPEYLKIISCV